MKLHSTTVVYAPIKRVFDLARCVSLHKRHFEAQKILPVRGKTSGVMDMSDHILWRGKFGNKTRQFFLDITRFERPEFFREEMRKDFFEFFYHDHFFREIDNGTIMIDQIEYQLPSGLMNKLVNAPCADKAIKRLLKERNDLIKEYAEGNNWQAILP